MKALDREPGLGIVPETRRTQSSASDLSLQGSGHIQGLRRCCRGAVRRGQRSQTPCGPSSLASEPLQDLEIRRLPSFCRDFFLFPPEFSLRPAHALILVGLWEL